MVIVAGSQQVVAVIFKVIVVVFVTVILDQSNRDTSIAQLY